MFKTHVFIEGSEFPARAAARRLGLGRDFYKTKGEVFEFGPRKGTQRTTSALRIPISDHNNYEKHMRQIETRLGELMTFLTTERTRFGNDITMDLSVGMTVGNEKYFTRGFHASTKLMSMLVALQMDLYVSAYPCSDEAERKSLKWSEGIGLMPGL